MLQCKVKMTLLFFATFVCLCAETMVVEIKDDGDGANNLENKIEPVFRCDGEHAIRHKHKKLASGECIPDPNVPLFLTKNHSIVTTHSGTTAILPCVLYGFVNGIVSWKRLKNYSLLTVGTSRYTSSLRYMAEHVKSSYTQQQWRLLINKVKRTDAGTYECQVSTYPPAHIHLKLRVTDAYAIINGGQELHIRNGSYLELTCEFMQITEEPSFVFWYLRNDMVSYDTYRGFSTAKNETSSTLIIKRVQDHHRGNYTCVAENIKPASIMLHILQDTDEKPAAMHTDDDESAAYRMMGNAIFVYLFALLQMG